VTRSQAFSVYRQTQTDTATREQAVVLLFEGMVRYLHQAREAMQTAQYETQSQLISRAQRILSELTAALDESQDEALVVSLRCCYTAMYNRLVQANIADDIPALDEVIGLAERFARAWRTALDNISSDVALAAVG
jgi:flagellar secretion chaperone FliS